jgi:hypothetical protein
MIDTTVPTLSAIQESHRILIHAPEVNVYDLGLLPQQHATVALEALIGSCRRYLAALEMAAHVS